jgi:hypothetical protein
MSLIFHLTLKTKAKTRLLNNISAAREGTMDNHHHHEEDGVSFTVGIFFIVVLLILFMIGLMN